MKLDKIYKKVQAGTAPEKEKAYLREEASKLKRINALLDEYNEDEIDNVGPVIFEPKFADADIDTIRKARRKFNVKMLCRIVIISVCSLIAIAVIVCGIIFIPSISSAKRNEEIWVDEAVELAKGCLSEHVDDVNDYYVDDIDKKLEINGHLNNSFYVYEIEFENTNSDEYQIVVNAKSGYVMLTDVDIHK